VNLLTFSEKWVSVAAILDFQTNFPVQMNFIENIGISA